MEVLFVLVARGGSKGIPGKNLREIGGQSLIGFKATGAKRSKYCETIIISTDSPAIQAEAERFGVHAPFIRPAELATDEAASSDVLLHALSWADDNLPQKFDAVMLLEPTTPFTRPSDYDAAVELMERTDAALVVGMRETEISSTFVGPMDGEGRIGSILDKMSALSSYRRQAQESEYTMNGALYLIRSSQLRETGKIYADRDRSYGIVMDPFHSIEIDRPIDLAWADFLVSNGYVDRLHWF